MSKRMIVWMLFVVLSAAGLALRPTTLHAQDGAVPDDDTELINDLDDELSAVEQENNPLSDDVVEAQILAALQRNKDINFDALEKEMEQGDTSIEAILDCAVDEAEGLSCDESEASVRRPNNGRLMLVAAPQQRKAPRPVVPALVATNFKNDVKAVHDKVKNPTNTSHRGGSALPNLQLARAVLPQSLP
jgi:hypothetical protein